MCVYSVLQSHWHVLHLDLWFNFDLYVDRICIEGCELCLHSNIYYVKITLICLAGYEIYSFRIATVCGAAAECNKSVKSILVICTAWAAGYTSTRVLYMHITNHVYKWNIDDFYSSKAISMHFKFDDDPWFFLFIWYPFLTAVK